MSLKWHVSQANLEGFTVKIEDDTIVEYSTTRDNNKPYLSPESSQRFNGRMDVSWSHQIFSLNIQNFTVADKGTYTLKATFDNDDRIEEEVVLIIFGEFGCTIEHQYLMHHAQREWEVKGGENFGCSFCRKT